MQLKDVKEKGFYRLDNETIFQVYENNGKDSKEYPLLVSTWDLFNVSNGRMEFEDRTGNDFAVEYSDNYEVIKVDDSAFKFEKVVGGGVILVENKMTYQEKLEKIAELCLKESKALKVSNDEIGDLVLVETDSAKFAKEILQIIKN